LKENYYPIDNLRNTYSNDKVDRWAILQLLRDTLATTTTS